jgi:hypothetical protein
MRTVSSKEPYRVLRVAGGPGATAVGAFGSSDGHVYAAIWNGTGFSTSDVTPFRRKPDFFAEPDAAVAPNGKIYVAFRNAAGGIYYSERQPNGSWAISKLASGGAYGTVSIDVDSANNLHMFWTSNISGGWDLWYAYKPNAGAWQGPVRAPVNAGILANATGTGTVGARAYGHGVAEEFNGNSAFVRYQQFSSELSGITAEPVLEGGNWITKNDPVPVSFVEQSGSPDGVRFHWDAPPTAADPWLPFANPTSVAAPPGVSANACSSHVLYAQVKIGQTIDQTPGQDGIVFDIGVQGAVDARNPNLASQQPTAAGASQGATDGDPRYSRDPQFHVSINGQADCAFLQEFNVPGVTSAPVSLLASNVYDNRFPLPASATPGPQTLQVQVADRLGNSKTSAFSLVYDPASTAPTGAAANTDGLPVLASGGKIISDTGNSALRTLTFEDIDVTDNLYGTAGEDLPAGKQFWGVWIANTTSPTATVDDADLQWFPVRVPKPDSTFSVSWSVFTGLDITSDLANQPGDYTIFVRFLDGAGNPSEGFLSTKVTLEPGYSLPTLNMPLVFEP